MQRIEYLDTARGFAMFLVVFAHTIAWNFADTVSVISYDFTQPDNVKTAGLLWQIIYSFHMALFFLISGYFAFKVYPDASARWKDLKKKTVSLLLPYFTTGFIMLLVKGHYGYWFFLSLWELAVFAVIFNILLATLNRKNSPWVDTAVFVVVYIAFKALYKLFDAEYVWGEPWKFVNYIVPYFFGYMMRKYSALNELLKGKYTLYLILFVLFFCARYIAPWESSLPMRAVYSLCQYVLPLAGSLLVIELFRTMSESRLTRYFKNVGTNTMDVYVMHIMFVVQLPAVGMFWLSTNPVTCITTQILYASAISAIAIYLSIISAKLLKRSGLVSLLLFGNRNI